MSPQEDAKTTSTSAHEIFHAIGSQAEQVAPTTEQPAATADGDQNDDDRRVVEEIESLCMNCHENGTTRLLLTRIPYFREIIVMSFTCDHCGFHNTEIQAAGSVQPRGTHYELRLTRTEDLSRQIVKADSATAKFIELDVEIPAGRGQLTNVEGLLSEFISDLEMDQDKRKEQHPELYTQIGEIIGKAKAMLAGESFPFRVSLDDPAGNSWIAPDLHDGVGQWEKREYVRTPEQNAALGLADTEASGAAETVTGAATAAGTTTSSTGMPTLGTSGSNGVIPVGGQGRLDENDNIIPDEVYTFPASCPGCMHPCVTHMKMVDIPHFQQVVLMNTQCDACGYRSNDVKTGGAIPKKGKCITVKVKEPEDLARDILKSESCALECPELNLSVNPGTLGGRFTTVEGLLTQVRDDLHNQIFQADGGASGGDSLNAEDRTRWDSFFSGLDDAIAGKRPFTVVLRDPLASSYVQSLADDPRQPDDQMTVEEYDRTDEEEEDLGLKDMKTEGYEGEAEAKAAEEAAEAAEAKAKAEAAAKTDGAAKADGAAKTDGAVSSETKQ